MNSGSEHSLFRFISFLSPLLYKVNIVARYDDMKSILKLENVSYFSIEEYYRSQKLYSRIIGFLKRLCGKDPIVDYFKDLLKKQEPDLIYINHLAIGHEFDIFFNCNINYIIHGHSMEQYYYNYDFSFLRDRLIGAKGIIATSKSQSSVLELLGCSSEKSVIYPFVDFNQLKLNRNIRDQIRTSLGIPEKTCVFCMASSYFNYNKDPMRFIKLGLRIMKLSCRDVYFLWIGGEQSCTANKMAESYLKEHNIINIKFISNCNHSEYIQYLNAIDILTLISIEESFSIVSLESIAMGKPVIAFDCGGVKEIVNDVNGIIVEPWSLDNMAEKAIMVKDSLNKYKYEEMKQSILQFDKNTQFVKWCSILDKNISNESSSCS